MRPAERQIGHAARSGDVGGLAEFERELIRARTDEGWKRAQSRGVKFGRKLKLSAFQVAPRR
jgi:DNA invertase Pin-like site-specific DNA recombinase